MLVTAILGILIALFAMFTLGNWRRGVYFMIIAASLQEPLRKVAEGTPAYFVLAPVPIFAAMVLGAMGQRGSGMMAEFRRQQGRVYKAGQLFLFALIPSLLMTLTYGFDAWKLMLLGSYTYFGLALGILLGFHHGLSRQDLVRLMSFYCVVVSVMLVGTLFEYMDLQWDVLGPEALGGKWVRMRTGQTIPLLTGFYRGPDIMGWHAVTMTMMAVTLILVTRGIKRWLCMGAASWGVISILLCGRRKIAWMLPVFLLVVLVTLWRRGKMGWALGTSFLLAITGLGVFFIAAEYEIGSSAMTFYLDLGPEVSNRIETSGIHSPKGALLKDAGPFGKGVGTATQGKRHLGVSGPRTWRESGAGKMAVELGWVGFGALTVVGLMLLISMFRILNNVNLTGGRDMVFAGLVGMFLANVGSFAIAGQVLGDPFIGAFFAILIGMALSWHRLRAQPQTQYLSAESPPQSSRGRNEPRGRRTKPA